MGFGYTLSPVMGSMLYSIGGFHLPFLFFGSIILLASVLIGQLLPQSID